MAIIFHNRFGTYSGETAGDVLRKIHANASQTDPTPCRFEDWKVYNAELWETKYRLDVPCGNDNTSETLFLKALYDVGAIAPGPRPQDEAAPRRHGLGGQ